MTQSSSAPASRPAAQSAGQPGSASLTGGRTPRQVAREENLTRIKDLALRQLAAEGAAGLSLRGIAREIGLVSSAIYRYYPSRDDLVTDLVLDAYRDLADALRAAADEASPVPGRTRWSATVTALRTWALAQPHRYSLLYGTPIPGYVAPPETIEPAVTVLRALTLPALRGPGEGGRSSVLETPEGRESAAVDPALAEQARGVVASLGLPDVDPQVLLRLVGAVARIHGTVALELNGQFVGGFEPADLLYAAAIADEADRLGLT